MQSGWWRRWWCNGGHNDNDGGGGSEIFQMIEDGGKVKLISFYYEGGSHWLIQSDQLYQNKVFYKRLI